MAVINLEELTIKKANDLLKSKEISCRELAAIYLENTEKQNKHIRAYLEIFDDVMNSAQKLDEEIARGMEVGCLTGIPLAIKDNILIKEKKCSAGSKILENYHAPYNATVIEKLKKAKAVFLGRTNMDEFAMGSSTENSAFCPTKNPCDLERVPGGSSGGSAAAVAMQGCLAALGSDTGGSIRQPAGLCGVVGLKPTYGSVSRYGLMAMASSLDQIGPITKNVEDAEIIFNVIKGRDDMDSTSVDLENKKKSQNKRQFKIGLLKYDKNGVSEEVNQVMEKTIRDFQKMGHEIEEVELPSLEYSMPCYYIIMPAEVSSNMARFDGVKYGLSAKGKNLLEDYMETRAEGFGKEVKRRIILGTYVLSAGYYDEYYGKAQKVRALIRRDFKNIFEKFDLILTPVSPTTAFKIGEKSDNPLEMYLSDIFTVSINLAGVPAISIPAKNITGMPVGIQLVAPWFREDLLFEAGRQYEWQF